MHVATSALLMTSGSWLLLSAETMGMLTMERAPAHLGNFSRVAAAQEARCLNWPRALVRSRTVEVGARLSWLKRELGAKTAIDLDRSSANAEHSDGHHYLEVPP
jgi:hypothetical protein